MLEFLLKNVTQLIISLGSITPVVVAIVKQTRASKKENKIIMDSLKELYAQNETNSNKISSHEKVTSFNLRLRTAIQSRAAQAISYSKLEQCHKSIMKELAVRIEGLAFGFYYNKNRGIDFEMKDYIDVEISDIKECISELIRNIKTKDNTKIIGWDKFDNPKIIYIYEFLLEMPEMRFWQYLDSLKFALEKNGFDNPKDEQSPDFIQTMIGYIKQVLNHYVDNVKQWDELKEVPEPPSKQMTKYA